MTITISLASDPDRRTVLHQCCSQLVWAGRTDDAERLWHDAERARDAQEVLRCLPDDVQVEVQP